ncbi:MAG TPA: cysteine--tRNA ligase [Candidatus Anoxymicrobiaceae bacterium]
MAIKIYNTMTRKKEELVTRDDGKVSMYVCGPTVYNYIHLGNARTFLNFDVIRRYLEFAGYEVTFVQNITDVDDKIINRASEEGTTADDVATRYRTAFEKDMDALGVKRPDIAPRATEHVPDMIEVISVLVDQGHAYESDGDVYFDVSSFADYGRLSRRDLEQQKSNIQCGPEAERKRDTWDFALWKAAKPGEPSWDSPWGPGRPGWHIECSTMSMKYLGECFDVHGGGLDLVFPHHENEIAQAEAYSGERFVKYWMHSGMLNIDQEKMSKSLGNIKSLREVLEEYDADTVRMLMLGTHYRSPLSFSDESLGEAHASLERIRNCLFNIDDLVERLQGFAQDAPLSEADRRLLDALSEADMEFRSHMDDDLNSAAAIGSIFGAVREINTYVGEVGSSQALSPAAGTVLACARAFLDEHCGALGLLGGTAAEGPDPEALARLARDAGISEAESAVPADKLVDLLCDRRQAARKDKDFALSDNIRDGLASLGVRVEDVKDGYRWRFGR